ncbi:MAG: hypothetical protein EPO11_01820 [Gammaproteobacteria bacterium]|nr:MAG: hypothetical protein EPO11_01820 [Gammaproteobacteria bacterium]
MNNRNPKRQWQRSEALEKITLPPQSAETLLKRFIEVSPSSSAAVIGARLIKAPIKNGQEEVNPSDLVTKLDEVAKTVLEKTAPEQTNTGINEVTVLRHDTRIKYNPNNPRHKGRRTVNTPEIVWRNSRSSENLKRKESGTYYKKYFVDVINTDHGTRFNSAEHQENQKVSVPYIVWHHMQWVTVVEDEPHLLYDPKKHANRTAAKMRHRKWTEIQPVKILEDGTKYDESKDDGKAYQTITRKEYDAKQRANKKRKKSDCSSAPFDGLEPLPFERIEALLGGFDTGLQSPMSFFGGGNFYSPTNMELELSETNDLNFLFEI